MTSPEYPDLPWVEPKSWTSGRGAGQPSLIVIHTTEGHEGVAGSESGAAYDARRTDGTSTHYHHDEDSTVQCVRTTDTAHTARRTGNRRGIHHELSGRAGQTPAEWADAASLGTLRQAAKQCARDASSWGIPVRRLTVEQVRAGERGFCGHAEISLAFGESTHTDPGLAFPWDDFIKSVKGYMVSITSEDAVRVFKTDGSIVTPTWRKEFVDGNLSIAASTAIQILLSESHGANVNAQSAATAGSALRSQGTVLGQKLDRLLSLAESTPRPPSAVEIAAAVIAALPPDRDDVTVQELAEAIRLVVSAPAGQ